MTCYTKVQICFFKPTGFEDTYIVASDHRGNAMVKVAALYPPDSLKFINSIVANHVDSIEGLRLVESKRAALITSDEPLEE